MNETTGVEIKRKLWRGSDKILYFLGRRGEERIFLLKNSQAVPVFAYDKYRIKKIG
jgi:hypothetical protein